MASSSDENQRGGLSGLAQAKYNIQKSFLSGSESTLATRSRVHGSLDELKTSPLFSGEVLQSVADINGESRLLPQYGLLAERLELPGAEKNLIDISAGLSTLSTSSDERIFYNVNTPSSTFLCGSQGSGKSHTLCCMLEAALQPSNLGLLPRPLSGLVFHFDRFRSYASNQVCEAAYLCSSGIPVRVLVSSSNFWAMEKAYKNLPGLPPNAKKPEVVPLLFSDEQLDSERLMTLMAFKESNGSIPLYMEAILRLLRDMAIAKKGQRGINYDEFTRELREQKLSNDQKGPLNLRLALLESFMAAKQKTPVKFSKAWAFEPGTLTIVDLSCPFVDESSACSLFAICLALFLENPMHAGRVIALDEAHKFMTASDSAQAFTETLLQVIRQQRHLAARVIIATQEPTISPKLLDLCSMTIVHRFTSPEWMAALKGHLAGVSEFSDTTKRSIKEVFDLILKLDVGQALLFSPTAMMDVKDGRVQRLGTEFIKMQTRKRVSKDGGKSVMGIELEPANQVASPRTETQPPARFTWKQRRAQQQNSQQQKDPSQDDGKETADGAQASASTDASVSDVGKGKNVQAAGSSASSS